MLALCCESIYGNTLNHPSLQPSCLLHSPALPLATTPARQHHKHILNHALSRSSSAPDQPERSLPHGPTPPSLSCSTSPPLYRSPLSSPIWDRSARSARSIVDTFLSRATALPALDRLIIMQGHAI